MKVERRDGYRVIVGGPVPAQASAITVGRTVVVRNGAEHDVGLLAHELVHVRQYVEMGFVPFLVRYVGSYLRLRLRGHGHMAAYRRIPLEVEASWASRARSGRSSAAGAVSVDAEPSSAQGAVLNLVPRTPRQRGSRVGVRGT